MPDVDPHCALTGQDFTFDGSGSYDNNGFLITDWYWDFEYDGFNFNVDASEEVVYHSYLNSNEYQIGLKVRNDRGVYSDIALETIQVVDDLYGCGMGWASSKSPKRSVRWRIRSPTMAEFISFLRLSDWGHRIGILQHGARLSA